MLSSVSLRCGRRVVTQNSTKRASKGQQTHLSRSRTFTTDKPDTNTTQAAQPKDSLDAVNNIFDKLKSSYKTDIFNTAQTVPGSSRTPPSSKAASWRPSRYVSDAKSDARTFANSFTGQVASKNATNPTPDVAPEFQKIINFNRDRLSPGMFPSPHEEISPANHETKTSHLPASVFSQILFQHGELLLPHVPQFLLHPKSCKSSFKRLRERCPTGF